MAITCSLRGSSSFDLRYAPAGKVHGPYNAPQITSTAGGLSGTVIRFNTATGGLGFIGRENLPQTDAISILLRCAPRASGTPAANRGFFVLGGNGYRAYQLELVHSATGGNLLVTQRGGLGTAGLVNASLGAWSPTAGTFYDLLLTYSGGTEANALKLYIDAVLFGQLTPTQNWTNKVWKAVNEFFIGNSSSALNCNLDVDEFVIWDSVIDPTSVALVSGTGSLNGAARTSLVNSDEYDGRSPTRSFPFLA